jgi:hypothetical protein
MTLFFLIFGKLPPEMRDKIFNYFYVEAEPDGSCPSHIMHESKILFLSNKIEYIRYWNFSYNTFVEEIVIPDSVKSIGYGAFSWCSSLKRVRIPNSVTTLGAYLFQGCHSIESIIIPNSVTTIGPNIFWDCHLLKKIVVPKRFKNYRFSASKAEIEFI